MASNTLGEWSDGEDDFVWQIDENLWEWDNTEDDNLIRDIDENDVLGEPIEDGLISDSDLQNEQTGRGEKRKSDEQGEQSLQGEYYYHLESVKKHL